MEMEPNHDVPRREAWPDPPAARRVLITGAAGRIGRVLRRGLAGWVPVLRLSDRKPLGTAAPHEEIVPAELGDPVAVEAAVRGVDAVVHLGAIPGEAAFDALLEANIRGTYHVLEAARRCGVPKVVLASTNHVTGFYPSGERVGPDSPRRPDTLYGVSKAFGEDLGSLYADRHGIQVLCLRIGSFAAEPTESHHRHTWISRRDMVQLVARCLAASGPRFGIVYGVSNNEKSWWDNPVADRIGYRPVDDAERFAGRWTGAAAREWRFQGGAFAG